MGKVRFPKLQSNLWCDLLTSGQNKHSVGDFETCSVETLVHRTECILHHSLLNRALSRWRHPKLRTACALRARHSLNPHTAAALCKEVLTPPPPRHPPPPKNGAPRWGGVGGQNRKNSLRDHFLAQMMILQGVGHPILQLEVCYADDSPKRGGGVYNVAPALDLLTLFQVIHWGDHFISVNDD